VKIEADLDRETLDIASQAWLAAYSREAMSRGHEVIPPPWEQLDANTQAAIKKCVLAALKAADAKNVQQVRLRRA
jgi:hypothetical protein